MKIIFFDFDGVIVDTFSFCHEIADAISSITPDEYRSKFEGNINHAAVQSGETLNSVDFFAEYTPRLMKCEPAREVVEAIKKLSATYHLVIVSSTVSPSIEAFLNACGLRGYFKEILGNDVEKSKVKKIRMMLDKYSVAPADTLFITDTWGDIKEARECDVKSIAVSWGFHPAETLAKGNPYKLLHKHGELLPAVENYFHNLV